MSRFLILLYGVLCYAIGMAGLILVIAFTVGVLSPWTTDSGAPGPLATAIVVDIVLLALFGLQHSIMARSGFKAVLTKIVPQPAERATYMLFTGIVSLILVVYWRPIDGQLWQVTGEPARTILYAIALGGWGFTALCSFLINHFDLFGLRQVWLQFTKTPYSPVPMKSPMFYRSIRHPMMLGILVAVWVTPEMTGGHLLMAIGFTAYILIGTVYEDRDLAKGLGADYSAYKSRTPAFFPFGRKG